MQVQALEDGFFGGQRIRAGTKFDVPEGTKAKWFVALDEVKASPEKKVKKDEHKTLADVAKDKGGSFTDVMAKTDNLA